MLEVGDAGQADGHRLPRLAADKATSATARSTRGLPNYGIDYYLSADAVASAPASKPYIVSLSGLKLADNLEMLGRALLTDGVAAIELNLACPNIPGKPTVALDFEQMEDVLKKVCAHKPFAACGVPLGVKLAPYFDAPHFDAAPRSSTSTRPPHLRRHDEHDRQLPDGRHRDRIGAHRPRAASASPAASRHMATANVKQLRQRLHDSIDVVGVGGVKSGADAFDLLRGAAAVQTATTHWSRARASTASPPSRRS